MQEVEKASDFIFFEGSDGNIRVSVIYGAETIWASQKMMAEIFGTSIPNINMHLSNIFSEGELEQASTIKKYLIVREEGNRKVSRKIDFYNLDAIISVGYRINSHQATQFRIWATKVLKEYLVKGFVLDDERLKQGSEQFGKDYFDELLERIREIRASERRFYQKVTDIYTQCSIDYDSKNPATHRFFATVQNKFHFAIHGSTAAEVILGRADARKKFMGLTTWKNSGQ